VEIKPRASLFASRVTATSRRGPPPAETETGEREALIPDPRSTTHLLAIGSSVDLGRPYCTISVKGIDWLRDPELAFTVMV
jgi:hypothetical protein